MCFGLTSRSSRERSLQAEAGLTPSSMRRRRTLEVACPQAVAGIYERASNLTLLPGQLCAPCPPPGQLHKRLPCHYELGPPLSVWPVFVLRYPDRA
jgi:hypothetical protein